MARIPQAALPSVPSGIQHIDTGTAQFIPGDRGIVLLVNEVPSSYWDVDPTYVEFEYLQHLSLLCEAAFALPQPLKVAHLGGAGCTLARAWATLRPRSRQLTIEIDGELARLVREVLPLPRSPELRIRVQDAAEAVAGFGPGIYDVVVRDAYAGSEVPNKLMGVDFSRQVQRCLRDNGCYLLNTVGRRGLMQARQEWLDLKQVFSHVIAIANPSVLKSRSYGNVVLAAANRPWDEALIARELLKLPMPASLAPPELYAKWTRTATLGA